VKYVLVDKGDNIVSTIDLASNVGISGAKTYFVGVKRIDSKEFDKLWKVMTRNEYDKKLEMGLRKPSSHGQIEWWKEDKEIIDDELKF
tara:strand:- start:84 stop:347 length:264 start_codon:yes stop_codon:yes gene_type:complete